jgi:hypothetical protein
VPSIGVDACDRYFKAAFACAASLEPPQRAVVEDSIWAYVPGWRGLAATPANREQLIKDCTGALEGLSRSPICSHAPPAASH